MITVPNTAHLYQETALYSSNNKNQLLEWLQTRQLHHNNAVYDTADSPNYRFGAKLVVHIGSHIQLESFGYSNGKKIESQQMAAFLMYKFIMSYVKMKNGSYCCEYGNTTVPLAAPLATPPPQYSNWFIDDNEPVQVKSEMQMRDWHDVSPSFGNTTPIVLTGQTGPTFSTLNTTPIVLDRQSGRTFSSVYSNNNNNNTNNYELHEGTKRPIRSTYADQGLGAYKHQMTDNGCQRALLPHTVVLARSLSLHLRPISPACLLPCASLFQSLYTICRKVQKNGDSIILQSPAPLYVYEVLKLFDLRSVLSLDLDMLLQIGQHQSPIKDLTVAAILFFPSGASPGTPQLPHSTQCKFLEAVFTSETVVICEETALHYSSKYNNVNTSYTNRVCHCEGVNIYGQSQGTLCTCKALAPLSIGGNIPQDDVYVNLIHCVLKKHFPTDQTLAVLNRYYGYGNSLTMQSDSCYIHSCQENIQRLSQSPAYAGSISHFVSIPPASINADALQSTTTIVNSALHVMTRHNAMKGQWTFSATNLYLYISRSEGSSVFDVTDMQKRTCDIVPSVTFYTKVQATAHTAKSYSASLSYNERTTGVCIPMAVLDEMMLQELDILFG